MSMNIVISRKVSLHKRPIRSPPETAIRYMGQLSMVVKPSIPACTSISIIGKVALNIGELLVLNGDIKVNVRQ